MEILYPVGILLITLAFAYISLEAGLRYNAYTIAVTIVIALGASALDMTTAGNWIMVVNCIAVFITLCQMWKRHIGVFRP